MTGRVLRMAVVYCLVAAVHAQEAGTVPAPESAAGDELIRLKRQVAEQQKQIEDLRRTLDAQMQLIDAALHVKSESSPASAVPQARSLGEVASTTPLIPAVAATPGASSPALQREPQPAEQPSPLSFRIGSAYLTPVGFMDFTAAYRDVDAGSGIGTNFGSFPYRTRGSVAGNLSEFRMSPQNSRLGMRIDALVKGAHVIGYWESDFLGGIGNPPVGNISVSTNSYPLRLRLFWVDVRKNKFEFLGGQSWSLLTPGRQGISPLPADVFYSQDIDVNYQLGLTCCRFPEFRMVYHATDKLALAFAVDNAEQYIGGSAGAGIVVLPSTLATAYAGELNNGATTLAVPSLHPDLIAKIAFDPSSRFHFEVSGIERTFKSYNPLTGRHYTAAGGGISVNLNAEVAKGLRLIMNNYWSDGGGRYIFGQAPDLVVRGDGSVSLVHAASEVAGFEYTRGNTVLYGYYGGVYIGKNAVIDPADGKFVGYGFPGSTNAQNRSIQEGTIGFTRTFWKDAKYGALALMGQYAYFTRNPWSLAAGAPKSTHMNEVFLNLRYTLPGSAPTIGR